MTTLRPKRTKKYSPKIQAVPSFVHIPKGHLRLFVSITQENGPVDKDEALIILSKREYAKAVIRYVTWRGTTPQYHVFSYPARFAVKKVA